jgi:hypothetical protein
MTLNNLEAQFPGTDANCQDMRQRRRAVRADPAVNGIDYVEVIDYAKNHKKYRKQIVLYLLKPAAIEKENITLSPDLKILSVTQGDCKNPDTATSGDIYCIELEAPASPGTFLLTLHHAKDPDTVLAKFDPLLSAASFSFDMNRSTEDDLPKPVDCPPDRMTEPNINYLAKDYASFRQLILDRLALIMPDWKERHVPDLGITLIEVLAYTGDYLSYYQDAVATEAYLHMARQRRSIRRHARLVDYRMHEGCNARAWVQIEVRSSELLNFDLYNTFFVTDFDLRLPTKGVVVRAADLEPLNLSNQYEVFEPVDATTHLYAAHNLIEFHTWGEQECCLPEGATHASLRDGAVFPLPAENSSEEKENKPPADTDECEQSWDDLARALDSQRVLRLKPGDVLIFEERIDPSTGNPADASPAHRHAVRLTEVQSNYDLIARQAVVEITWDRADALPFPLCISATTTDCDDVSNISVALGNIILVDHGRTVSEGLDSPEPAEQAQNCDPCGEIAMPRSRRYQPRLKQHPLIYREPVSELSLVSAHFIMDRKKRNPRAAVPEIMLTGIYPPQEPGAHTETQSIWEPDFDLIGSGPDDREFVVEPDDEGIAHLRFGDGELGESPMPGMHFTARYRVGTASRGNVGADAIRRLIMRTGFRDDIISVRNPLPAVGGIMPESSYQVKLRAPHQFRRRLERAVTEGDYEALVERRFPEIQRAYAQIEPSPEAGRYLVKLWYDPLVNAQVTAEQVEAALHPYRRIGYDISLQPLRTLTGMLKANVKHRPNAIAETVKAALEILLGHKHQGLFDPDRLTFGTVISMSEIAAAIQQVAGVAYVETLTMTLNNTEYRFPVTDTQKDYFVISGDLFPQIISVIEMNSA